MSDYHELESAYERARKEFNIAVMTCDLNFEANVKYQEALNELLNTYEALRSYKENKK
jgi:hypothetical protein